MPNPRLRRGFTLIELLVVIATIGILVALLLPAVQQSRQAASRVSCKSRMHQLGIAMQNYASTHKIFPPGGVHMTTKKPGTVPSGNQRTDGRAPWTVLILPFLEQTSLYNSFNMDGTFAARADLTILTPQENLTAQFQPVPFYTCPSDPNSSFIGLYSNYAACQGGGTLDDAAGKTDTAAPRYFYDNGMFFHNSSIKPDDLIDGTSKTVMIGETKYVGNPQSFASTNAWWPWSAAIRADDNQQLCSLFNISATVDPINFPQNGEYTEADVRRTQGLAQGDNHGGQQRVFGSWHQGGAHFLMADGSVLFLNENMDVATYRSLGKRADGIPTTGFPF